MDSVEERSKILMEKMKRMYTPPTEFFRKDTNLYSAFDSDGVPTHDASGNEIKKSTLKKLRKDWEKQAKLYNSRDLT
jgi:cysteinyl-tRNA synthetase